MASPAGVSAFRTRARRPLRSKCSTRTPLTDTPSSVLQRVPRHKTGRAEAAGEATTVDDEALTGDVARRIGGQEDAEWSQLPPFAKAPDGHHLPPPARRLSLLRVGGGPF